MRMVKIWDASTDDASAVLVEVEQLEATVRGWYGSPTGLELDARLIQEWADAVAEGAEDIAQALGEQLLVGHEWAGPADL